MSLQRRETEVAPPSSTRWTVGTLVYTRRSLAGLYGWLLWGDFAWQLKDRTGPMVQVILGEFKASDFVTALFMYSLPALITMTVGPTIGYLSDRYRSRLGRRIPFLLGATPVAGLALMAVACAPLIADWLGTRLGWPAENRNGLVLLVMGLAWTVFEVATVAANAVFGALINDVVPRPLIGRFFGLFRVISLGVGILLYYYIMGWVREHYMPILVAIAGVYTVGFLLMCVKVKEGDYPPPDRAPRRSVLRTVKDVARDCFAQPYYLLVFAFMACALTAFIPVNLYMVFAAQRFGVSLADYGKYMALIFGVSLVVAYPLGVLADRFHAARVGLTCIAAYALSMGMGFFVVRGAGSFAAMLIVHGVLSVCYNTGVSALGQMLFPKEKFALFAASAGVVASLASVLASPLVGLMLDALDHDYRYTFGLSCLLGLVALWLGVRMYRRFLSLGGPDGYVAPV